MTDVLPQTVQPRGHPYRARILARQQRVAHRAACGTRGVQRRLAALQEIAFSHLAMELQLVLEFHGRTPPSQPVAKPTPPRDHLLFSAPIVYRWGEYRLPAEALSTSIAAR